MSEGYMYGVGSGEFPRGKCIRELMDGGKPRATRKQWEMNLLGDDPLERIIVGGNVRKIIVKHLFGDVYELSLEARE